MREIRISDRIRYIEATDTPLSADIGFVEDGGRLWLYDVGDGERAAAGLTGSYRVVLSHFHRDHTGNLPKIRAEELYVSRETYLHAHAGTVVEGERRVGDLRIFSLPSSHCKGCLGLEVAETYAFVGDALYCRVKDGFRVYNAQLLKAEIDVLSDLRSPYLLVSHRPGLIRERAEAIDELRAIYARREKNSPEIRLPFGEE